MQHPDNLIWIDLEMTGLDPDNDVIIEIATIVTDAELNVLAEGPSLAVKQPDALLDGMDEWNTCLLYTSDAADDSLRVDLGGRRIIKKNER